MQTISDVRRDVPNLEHVSDEQLAQYLHQAYAPCIEFDKFAPSVGYNPGDNFVRGLKMAGRNTLGAGAAAGALVADQAGWNGARDSALEYGGRGGI